MSLSTQISYLMSSAKMCKALKKRGTRVRMAGVRRSQKEQSVYGADPGSLGAGASQEEEVARDKYHRHIVQSPHDE
jgi:hypothetical protein